jgi:O-methyltransferase domain/Dimerisation domain
MNTDAPSPERLLQLAWGYAPTLTIEAAVTHGVFDHLASGPAAVTTIAEKTGASIRGLRALMDALVGLQLLTRDGENYALLPESRAFLTADSPASLAPFFRHMGRQLIPVWLELPESVRTGRPAAAVNRETGGSDFFAAFVESLFPLSYQAAQALGRYLGIPGTTAPVSVLDLGAGSGVWGIALAELSSHVRILAVDWPKVLAVTESMAQRRGVADRMSTVAGDLQIADFGRGHHVATIGHILHSEGEERSKALLRRTFDALSSGGTVAIMEFLVDPTRKGPPTALLFALNMLVHTEHGGTYTFEEIAGWLTEAGFVDARLLPVPAQSPLVLATKP